MSHRTRRTAVSVTIAMLAACAGTAASAAQLSPQVGGDASALLQREDVTRLDLPEGTLLLWEDDTDNGLLVPRFAFTAGGEWIDRVGDAPRQVGLVTGGFDPLEDPQPRVEALDAAGSGDLRLVQLAGPTLGSLRSQIERSGGRIVGYLPEGTFIVRAGEKAAGAIGELPFVRWVGDYLPSYRVAPQLRNAIAAGVAPGAQGYSIMLLERGPAAHATINGFIEGLGGRVDLPGTMGRRLEATLDADQLAAVAAHPLVEFIDRATPKEDDMDVVREFGGANHIEQMGGFTGTGVRAEVMDGGLRTSHADFQSNPPIINNGNSGSASHGTPVFGIVFGDGTANPRYRGMMPDAQGIFSDYGHLGDRYQHTSGLVQAPHEAVFQTNSWGNGRTFLYTTISAEMDDIIFDLDITITQSQSNAGNQDSRPQAWAKNIVSVGGVRHRNTLSRADDRWDQSGSVGPAADGRIKPDLAHFYDSTGTTSSSSNTSYTDFGGTSGATPITAGHFGLMYEMWAAGIFGNDTSGGSVFEERPHAATAKAMMINTATPYDVQSPADDSGRYRQGWGTTDVGRLYDRRDRFFVVDETDPVEPMGANAYELLAPGGDELRVTMIFADPPANPGADRALVNDLSLRLTSPSGEIYWGNHGMLDTNASSPGGAPDSINNVENVWVPDAEAGVWVAEVIAHGINQDGRPETPELDADYALVASGVTGTHASEVVVRLPEGVPEFVTPGEATPLRAQVISPATPTSVELNAAAGGGPFQAQPMSLVSSEGDVHTYEANLPIGACGEPFIHFWIEAEAAREVVTSPAEAPSSFFETPVRIDEVAFEEDFSSGAGWTVQNVSISTGAWQLSSSGTGGSAEPRFDWDGNDRLYLTDARGGQDVDGGPTRLISPVIDASGLSDAWVSFAWFLNCDSAGAGGEDTFEVEVSEDGGSSWQTVEVLRANFAWREYGFRIADFVEPTDGLRVRFSVADNPNNSFTEAAIDTFRVVDRGCDACPIDFNGDGVADVDDFFAFLDLFATGDNRADLDGNGTIDTADFFAFLDAFAVGC